MDKISIVTPKVDMSPVSKALREITRAITEKHPLLFVGGALGGIDGYGAEWNTDVFEMHPYCWCDLDSCPWCAGGELHGFIEPDVIEAVKEHGGVPDQIPGHGAPNFWHKPTSLRIWWYKYIGRSMELYCRFDQPIDIDTILKECLEDIGK